MRINIAVMSVAFTGALLWHGTAQATDPVTKCQEQKLKAQGKLELCLKKNSAKVLGGKTDTSAACQMKFQGALTKAGTACRYVDNGDGTVSDLDTGLQWEQKHSLDGTANPSDPRDADNLYTLSASGTALDGTAYTDFQAQLNNGASTDGGATTPITGCFAGHCDWRLPTIVELQGIIDLSASGCDSGNPCIDPAFGPTQAGFYWSADAGGPDLAWSVVFGNGVVFNAHETFDGYVRAVRGGL